MGLFKDLDIASASSDPFSVEDGTYLCTVKKVAVQKTKDESKTGLTFSFEIDEDDENENALMHGRKIDEWLTIPEVDADGEYVDPEKGPIFMSFLKRRLESLGVPEEEMNTVDNEDLLGISCVVTVKTKGDYQNITKLVLRGDAADDGGWGNN